MNTSMSTNDTVLHHYREIATQQAQQNSKNGVSWLEYKRQRAASAVRHDPLPSRKDEPWHYAVLKPFYQHLFTPLDEDLTLSYKDIDEFVVTGEEGVRLVLFNGQVLQELSHLPDIQGLEITSLQEAIKQQADTLSTHLGKLSDTEAHLFTHLNTAAIQDGAYIHVARNAIIEQPIEIIHVSLAFSGKQLSQPRHLVILEENSQASLLESHVSLGDSYCFNNIVTEIFLNDAARLEHGFLQDESRDTYHLSCLHVQQGRDSYYHETSALLGAAWSRAELHVALAGEGSECLLDGLYMANTGQTNNVYMRVDHQLPHGTSKEHFKGLVAGNGKAAFDGTVIVQQDAQRSNAELKNANLLLSRDAEVDSKPVLEIKADDVKCSHGTSIGQIDSEMLFYLQSRGIPDAAARRLVCSGFAAEVFENCPIDGFRHRLMSLLEQRLSEMAGV